MLAVVSFLGLVASVGTAFFVVTSEGDERSVTAAELDATRTARASEESRDPAVERAGAARAAQRSAEASTPPAARSLDMIVWTNDVPTTLQELSRTWSIPSKTLAELNPELAAKKRIDAGVEVVVYSNSVGPSASVGFPNNGRLRRGVPLPEGRAWVLPEDRGRAFATTETIAVVTGALEAYGRRFPEAEPIEVGDLSARRGGAIYGHQSHQTGRDVDIRLIQNATRDGFDAGRNWFLVRTLLDSSDITAIFLNKTEQAWLREAAEADVGAAATESYFGLIRHEPGHTSHMHIRFQCPEDDRGCVNYSLADTEEQDTNPRSKLRLRPGRNPSRARSKLPGLR